MSAAKDKSELDSADFRQMKREKEEAKNRFENKATDYLNYEEIVRVTGDSKQAEEFKLFQKEFTEGKTDNWFKWLQENINFFDESTKDFIERERNNKELHKYTLLFPTNDLVNKYNRQICE